MNKLFNLALTGALALGFAACSSDDIPSDGSEDIVKDGFYIQLNLISATDNDSRADFTDAEDSNLYQTGLADESEVNTAYLYIFRASDGKFETVEALGNAATNDGINSPKRIASPLQVNTPYHAYLICNYKYTNRDGSAADPTTEEEFVDHIQKFDLTIGKYMPMTSRESGGRLYCSFTLTSDANRNSEDPMPLNFTIERSVGRIAIDLKDVDKDRYTLYSSENENDRIPVGTVYLNRYKIINYLPDTYLFRHVGHLTRDTKTNLVGSMSNGPVQSTNIVNGNHYVIDPYTISTTAADFSQYSSNTEYSLISPDGRTYDTSLDGTKLAVLGYPYENTVYNDYQVKGNLTAVFFRGHVEPLKELVYDLNSDGELASGATYNDGDVLYYDLRNFRFYSSFNAVKVALKNETVPDDAATLRTHNIVKYPKGYIYFQYFIRHRVATENDHSDLHDSDSLAVMEYAIVRNNSYNIKVTDIVMPGSADDTYDPLESVELSEYYLKAKLTVKPWIVRTQNISLGGDY